MKYPATITPMEVEGHRFYAVHSNCIVGCVAQGNTLEEAVKLFDELEAGCIDCAEKYGIEIENPH